MGAVHGSVLLEETEALGATRRFILASEPRILPDSPKNLTSFAYCVFQDWCLWLESTPRNMGWF